jgi:hypothetical protein
MALTSCIPLSLWRPRTALASLCGGCSDELFQDQYVVPCTSMILTEGGADQFYYIKTNSYTDVSAWFDNGSPVVPPYVFDTATWMIHTYWVSEKYDLSYTYGYYTAPPVIISVPHPADYNPSLTPPLPSTGWVMIHIQMLGDATPGIMHLPFTLRVEQHANVPVRGAYVADTSPLPLPKTSISAGNFVDSVTTYPDLYNQYPLASVYDASLWASSFGHVGACAQIGVHNIQAKDVLFLEDGYLCGNNTVFLYLAAPAGTEGMTKNWTFVFGQVLFNNASKYLDVTVESSSTPGGGLVDKSYSTSHYNSPAITSGPLTYTQSITTTDSFLYIRITSPGPDRFFTLAPPRCVVS